MVDGLYMRSRPCIKSSPPGGNIKAIEPEVDELIACLLKIVSWHMKKL